MKGFAYLMGISTYEVRIVKAGPERIEELESLWKALHMHYQDIGSCFPCLSIDQSWAIARIRHKELLSEMVSFMLFAEYRDMPVGYAIVHVKEVKAVLLQIPDKVASLEYLSVLPEAQNMGIGTALMNTVYEELCLSNITALTLDVICTNKDALRFYERFGFTPFFTTVYQSIPQKQEAEQ